MATVRHLKFDCRRVSSLQFVCSFVFLSVFFQGRRKQYKSEGPWRTREREPITGSGNIGPSRGRAAGQVLRGGLAPWSWKLFSFWTSNGIGNIFCIDCKHWQTLHLWCLQNWTGFRTLSWGLGGLKQLKRTAHLVVEAGEGVEIVGLALLSQRGRAMLCVYR